MSPTFFHFFRAVSQVTAARRARASSFPSAARVTSMPGLAVLPDGRLIVTWNYIADDKAKDRYYERA
jgi:hypothetical protein